MMMTIAKLLLLIINSNDNYIKGYDDYNDNGVDVNNNNNVNDANNDDNDRNRNYCYWY